MPTASNVFGVVAPDGKVLLGTNYTVKKTGTGKYELNFNPAFNKYPVAAVTPYCTIDDPNMSAHIYSVSKDKIEIRTGSKGSISNQGFAFIAVDSGTSPEGEDLPLEVSEAE